MPPLDPRFTAIQDPEFAAPEAERSRSQSEDSGEGSLHASDGESGGEQDSEDEFGEETAEEVGAGMDPSGFAGPSEKTVKPLTPEALAVFKAAQDKAGVVYISRIPPGMRPTKVRHLMSAYGEVGRVYLQQEDAKRAYLRRKYTATKKAHYTEGWVEFKDKRVARSIAEMLNAQPIGGKKGTRWRDDVWTMKYLPRFKWNMLTEQIAHEAAVHAAQLRVEISQSRKEQKEYLKNVELARVLSKRAERKRKADPEDGEAKDEGKESRARPPKIHKADQSGDGQDGTQKGSRKDGKRKKPQPVGRPEAAAQLDLVLNSMF